MKVKTNQCCLYCIAAKPEHVLACGHSICDNCVRIFGEADKELEHCYNIGACILCKEPTNLKVVLKPPTAGVRILSVDGGGVRGIVPLEFLHLLQQKLGAQCKVQDMFDLAVGTSAGKVEQLYAMPS